MAASAIVRQANRQWNTLQPNVCTEIDNWRFIHPTALLIKELTFEVREQDSFWERTVQVKTNDDTTFFRYRLRSSRHHRVLKSGDLDKFFRYQIYSDERSGIVLGRVRGVSYE